ncbi:BtrH N-terminal domain-containing protein [Paenibacillus aquistagni]|uniref:BtrH N-terminal domain-containing protein n=1 Tax=Paenibacillus aquistagni TaxID=1852522 RepID=UPI00145BA5E8|nr:BtrH N-terminal domain-containing protein [Paenibacillus aquistagni]NMM53188.1 BtrH N-terminal domain-containing protein [Paenibacillus aquistagni]
MKLNINPVSFQGLDCIDVLVVSYAKFLGREVSLIFGDSWSFKFNENPLNQSDTLGDRIGLNSCNVRNILEKKCGVGVEFTFSVTPNDIMIILEKELNNGIPIGIYIDSFYCPWHDRYKQDHGNHYCLAIGLDKNKGIICIDPAFMPDSEGILPFDDFVAGSDSYFVFNVSPSVIIDDYKAYFYESLEKISNSNMFSEIRRCSEVFGESFDYYVECANIMDNPWWCNLFRKLISISGGRRQFLEFVDYVSLKSDLCIPQVIIERFNEVCSKWDVIRFLLVKHNKSGFDDAQKKKISELMYYLADEEEEICEMLIRGETTTFESQTKLIGGSSNSKCTCVNLKPHFNNRAFGNLSENNSADFTGLTEWYLGDNFEKLRSLKIDRMSFEININDTMQRYDNISCDEQKVKVPQGRYNSIMILAAAENGDFYSTIFLDLFDDSKLELHIKVSDWTKPSFNEDIAFMTRRVHKYNQKAEIIQGDYGYLYGYKYKIPTDNLIKSITLPICPNIHIFAISLV